MNGREFEGLGRPLGGAGGAYAVGVFAFLVAALVFFTEATLTAAPIREVTVELAVTMFCCVIVYLSMSEAGMQMGEERDEVRLAREELAALTDRIRREGRAAGLAAFCRSVALEERENLRADLLAEVGLDAVRFRELCSDRAALLREGRRVRRAVRRSERLRLLRISPELLLYGGERPRRTLLPPSAAAVRGRATLRAMVPALLGSLMTVSVALGFRAGLDAAAVVSAVFRLLALVSTGARGHSMGYRSVTVDGVRSMKSRAGYLVRYLSAER